MATSAETESCIHSMNDYHPRIALQSDSARSTAASMSDASSPGNARVPISTSKHTHPNAHTSLRASAVDRRNMGMIQRSEALCCAFEVRDAVRIGRKRVRQDRDHASRPSFVSRAR